MSCGSRFRGITRGNATDRLLELQVLIPPVGHGCLCVVCCQVEASASGRSLVQRIPDESDVSAYDHEAWIMRRPCPSRVCCTTEKNISPGIPQTKELGGGGVVQ